ncbi:hypothetical protein DBR17_15825, partial [Sphingomonas sp. HMWF008]
MRRTSTRDSAAA